MTALELRLPDGRTRKVIVRRPGVWAVKRNPHAARDEFRLLHVLQSYGLPIQMPYLLDESGEVFPAPYLVIEYIEGNPDLAPSDLSDYILQLATYLAAIHRVGGSDPAISFLPQRPSHVAGMPEEALAAAGSASERQYARSILESGIPPEELNSSVLLHGDYWPGNVLWRDGRLVAVVDWEDTEIGDPLADVAISRLDMLWAFDIEAMNDFTLQYESKTSIDFRHLPYWDLRAALRVPPTLGEWATVYPPFGRKDITEKTMREGVGLFVAQALEKLTAQ
jgi:aminoglycoside phosphotransferase (APT) family kinase protein